MSRYALADWYQGKIICKSFGLELVSLETLTEAEYFYNLCHNNDVTVGWIFIDGMTLTPKSSTDWYWTNSGKKISYPIPWFPGQPDNYNEDEQCLTISHTNFLFNDQVCQNYPSLFVCQRIDYFISRSSNV